VQHLEFNLQYHQKQGRKHRAKIFKRQIYSTEGWITFTREVNESVRLSPGSQKKYQGTRKEIRKSSKGNREVRVH
jgi:hypothetical protein